MVRYFEYYFIKDRVTVLKKRLKTLGVSEQEDPDLLELDLALRGLEEGVEQLEKDNPDHLELIRKATEQFAADIEIERGKLLARLLHEVGGRTNTILNGKGILTALQKILPKDRVADNIILARLLDTVPEDVNIVFLDPDIYQTKRILQVTVPLTEDKFELIRGEVNRVLDAPAVLGQYSSKTNTIVINAPSAPFAGVFGVDISRTVEPMINTPSGVSVETLLHEFTHASTVEQIDRFQDILGIPTSLLEDFTAMSPAKAEQYSDDILRNKAAEAGGLFAFQNLFTWDNGQFVLRSSVTRGRRLVNFLEDRGFIERGAKNTFVATDRTTVFIQNLHQLLALLRSENIQNRSKASQIRVVAELQSQFISTHPKILFDLLEGAFKIPDFIPRSARTNFTKDALGLFAATLDLYKLTEAVVRILAPQEQAKLTFGVSYGGVNVYEFITQAYSNLEFQEFLNNKKPVGGLLTAKGKNIWEQFVDAVRKMLGFKSNEETMLSQAIRAIYALEESNKPFEFKPFSIVSSFARAASAGGMDFNTEAQAKTQMGAIFRKLNAGTKRFLNENDINIDPSSGQVGVVLNAANKQPPYTSPLNDLETTLLFNKASESASLQDKVFGGIDKTIKSINENTPKSIDSIIDKVSEMPAWWRRIYYGLLSLGHLSDTVRRFNPALANAIDRIERVTGLRTARVEDIRMRFRKEIVKVKRFIEEANVSAKTLKRFYILSHDSTIADEDGKRIDLREVFLDPPNPTDANYEERMRIRNSELFKEFSQFPRELHLVYKTIVDTYEIVGEQYINSIAGQFLDTTGHDNERRKLNERINDRTATPEDIAKAQEDIKRLDEKILSQRQKKVLELFGLRISPFLPLVRRGDYWIKEKIVDPEFAKEKQAIEEMEKNNLPKVEIDKAKEALKQKLEAGKNAGRSWAFEYEREAKRAKRILEKGGGTDPVTGEVIPPVEFENEYGDNGVFTRSGNPTTFEDAILGESTKYREELRQLMDKLRGMGYTDAKDPTTGEYVDPRMAELLLDLQEKFLDTHSNESLVQQWRTRREIPGYQIDLVENFAHMAMKYANQIALLETSPELTAAMLSARQVISATPSSVERSVDETLKGRSSFLRDPTPSRWSAMAAYGGYSWFILGNVSSAAVNTTQLGLLAYPLMAGEFGWNKTADVMLSTMKMFSQGGRDDNTNLTFAGINLADWTLFHGDNLNNDNLKKHGLTAEEMKELRDAGLSRSRVRRSSAQELQDVRRGSSASLAGFWARAELFLGWLFQNTERLNREIALVSAYRLAKGKYKNATRAQNMERALQLVEEANGPSTAEVGPEWIQNNLGKSLGVFKKFAFHMTYMQWKLARDAFLTAGKVERNPNLPEDMPSVQQLAKRQFFATLIPAYVFAGIRGLPFIGGVALLYNLLADDDDPTWNEAVRAAVGDMAYLGPTSHYMNVNFSSRTGFYSMLYRDDPYRRAKVGDLAYTFESFLGPVYSASVGNIDRASRFLEEGRSFDAIQATLPSFLRNGMKAYDLAMNGALNSKGYPLVDDVNGYNAAMQFLGFSPTDVSKAYEKNEFVSRRRRAVYTQRSRLLTQYYMALKMGDQEEVSSILKKINEYNSKPLVQQMGRTISGKTISKSVNTRDRKSREAIDGLVLPLRERIAIERELGY